MSTQNDEAALYFSELIRQKDAKIEALLLELEAARKEREHLILGRELLTKSEPEPEQPVEPAKEVPVEEPKPVEVPVPTPPKRRGRQKGSKNKPKANPKAKNPEAKKAKAKKPEATRQITRGSRPPLKRTMHEILGADRVLSAPEMIEELKDRGCMPQSRQPQVLVSWTFSNNRDAFIRVSHGRYRSNPTYRPRNSLSPATSAPLSKAEVDSELANMGLGDVNQAIENPFQS